VQVGSSSQPSSPFRWRLPSPARVYYSYLVRRGLKISGLYRVWARYIPLPFQIKYQVKSENFGLKVVFFWEGRSSYDVGSNLYLDHEMRFAESVFGVYAWRKYSALESDEYGAELVRLLSFPFSFQCLEKSLVRAWC
jgi:hypothetical protein